MQRLGYEGVVIPKYSSRPVLAPFPSTTENLLLSVTLRWNGVWNGDTFDIRKLEEMINTPGLAYSSTKQIKGHVAVLVSWARYRYRSTILGNSA